MDHSVSMAWFGPALAFHAAAVSSAWVQASSNESVDTIVVSRYFHSLLLRPVSHARNA
jgi:hypothetical protein